MAGEVKLTAQEDRSLTFLGMKVRLVPGLPENAGYLESRLPDGSVQRVKIDFGPAGRAALQGGKHE